MRDGLTRWARERRRRREAAALRAEVALTADLLAMALGAGLTPYLALDVVARCGPPLAGRRLSGLLAAPERRLGDALEVEAGACPPLEGVLRVLAACERLGAPAAPALSRLAVESRAQARQEAMARARRVPVRLLFPLVFLVLPAFVVLTVAPVLLAGFAR